jgi:hypothetical protein
MFKKACKLPVKYPVISRQTEVRKLGMGYGSGNRRFGSICGGSTGIRWWHDV